MITHKNKDGEVIPPNVWHSFPNRPWQIRYQGNGRYQMRLTGTTGDYVSPSGPSGRDDLMMALYYGGEKGADRAQGFAYFAFGKDAAPSTPPPREDPPLAGQPAALVVARGRGIAGQPIYLARFPNDVAGGREEALAHAKAWRAKNAPNADVWGFTGEMRPCLVGPFA